MPTNQSEQVWIAAPHLHAGAVLEAEYLRRPNSETIAIICHPNPLDGGTMHSKVISTLYRFCRDFGAGSTTGAMDIIRYNSRGVGKSDGIATATYAEFADARCVLDWAMNQRSYTKIWLLGFSFGGYMACCLADLVLQEAFYPKLEKLVLIAPSIERFDLSTLLLPYADTVMVFADNDRLVTPQVMADFVYRHGIRHRIIAGAGHLFHGRLTDLKLALQALTNDKA